MLRLLGVATIYYTECMGTEFDFIGWFLCSYVAQNATQRSLLPRHGRTLSCKHIQISNGSSSFDMYEKTVGFQGGNLGLWSNMKGRPAGRRVTSINPSRFWNQQSFYTYLYYWRATQQVMLTYFDIYIAGNWNRTSTDLPQRWACAHYYSWNTLFFVLEHFSNKLLFLW